MKRVVYKYKIPVRDVFNISLPKRAEFLLAAVQLGTPQLWAMVDPDEAFETRAFRLVGTGHTITDPERLTHIGSFLDGSFVWHLFEVTG